MNNKRGFPRSNLVVQTVRTGSSSRCRSRQTGGGGSLNTLPAPPLKLEIPDQRERGAMFDSGLSMNLSFACFFAVIVAGFSCVLLLICSLEIFEKE